MIAVLAKLAARSQRVGGIDVAPGRSAVVNLGGAGEGDRSSVTAWVGVGMTPGPRISVVAAVRGFEVAATLAARALMREIDLSSLQGTLVVVPVCRPGDRFVRVGRGAAPLSLPGDPGGTRRARLAFAIHADVVVNADQVIVLGAPRFDRRGLLTAEAVLDDLRAKKLALASGAPVVLPAAPPKGSLMAAVVAAGRVGLRLSVATGAEASSSDAALLLGAVRRVLGTLGAYPLRAPSDAPPPRICTGRALVRGSRSGVLDEAQVVGTLVSKGAPLARLGGVVPGQVEAIVAPTAGVVIEAPATAAVRKGSVLFVIGRAPVESTARATVMRVAPDPSTKLRAGWVERASLPELGIGGLPAKIDTGARTSALHVISSRTVGRGAGPSRRPILELVLPAGGSSRRRLVIRTPVKEFIDVRDTSGRLERRPVIETKLALGPLQRRIRITLTDRGDMRYPMLIGRTGLGAGVVVDPAARNLLGGPRRTLARTRTKRGEES